MSDFFRLAWEQPDDSGAAPEETPEAVDPAVPTEQPEAAPETYTRDELVEALGPRFAERYAGAHDGLEAFKQFGQSFDQTLGLVGRGAHLEPQDEQFYRDLGIEPPAQEEPEEEPATPLWGAPWAEPTDYDSFIALANTRPDKAMEFIDRQPEGVIDADTRTQVLNYWAQHDQAAAIGYERQQARQQAIDEAKAYADQMREEMRAEFAPVQAGHVASTNEARQAKLANLATLATTSVPDFSEHQAGVTQMLERYGQEYGIDYFDRLLALPVDQQLAHITELTGAVAWRGRPAAEAQAQAESAAADAAKVAAGGERGRGAAGTSGGQTQKKREFTASFERLRDVEIPIR